MLKERIYEDMKQAMKEGDKRKLAALRLALAALKEREIEIGRELSQGEVVELIRRMIKQRRESARHYALGGRKDLEEAELNEVQVLSTYLPPELDEKALHDLIEQAIQASAAKSMRDMGRVMALLKERLQGRADPAKVAKLVKTRLMGG